MYNQKNNYYAAIADYYLQFNFRQLQFTFTAFIINMVFTGCKNYKF
jgi:hypothetical protein